MLPDILKIKGVHPGAVLSRELKIRGIESKQFAAAIDVYPQTLSAIRNEKRGINPTLSIKLGKALGVDDAYFMLLQAYYEVEQARKALLKDDRKPNMDLIRPILFWDTDIQKIDWQAQQKAVVKRIFERGNDAEIEEIISFYGRDIVIDLLKSIPVYLPTLVLNAAKYLDLKLPTNNESQQIA